MRQRVSDELGRRTANRVPNLPQPQTQSPVETWIWNSNVLTPAQNQDPIDVDTAGAGPIG